MPHIHDLYDFTVSAYVLHPTETKLCLHLHRKLHRWLQAGGHIELNEQPLEALHHELEEELGLKPHDYEFLCQEDTPRVINSTILPRPIMINVHRFGPDTEHRHIDLAYFIRAKITSFKPAESESPEIRWLTIDEMKVLHSEGILDADTLAICEWLVSKNM